MKVLLSPFFAAIAAFGPAVAFAGAALVVDLMGDITPEPEAFTELEQGASLVLGPEAQIILMHYASCLESQIKGGRVEVTARGLTLTDGAETVAETEVECPRKVAFEENSGTIAAVVLRGGEDRVVINPTPVFLVLGRDGVAAVTVMRGDAPVGAATVQGGVARWDGPALAAGEYELILTGPAGERRAMARVAAGAGVTIIDP